MKFLHTSDWQLGMTRHFLDEHAQGRFAQARVDVIRTMARLATDRGCDFVVVAGDVFETNQVDRATIARALDALEVFDVPVYLLPGNHDCAEPGSVYRSRAFTARGPAHVEVLDDATPRFPVAGVEVVGAPWRSKRPLDDLVTAACASPLQAGRMRVVVGHGRVDSVVGEVGADPSLIRLAALDRAIADDRVHYVALGDRHSTTDVGASGRIWYSGAPEPTAHTEIDAGNALVVELSEGRVDVEPVRVGTWRFERIEAQVDTDDDVAALAARLDAIDDKARTIVKLGVTGTVSLRVAVALDSLLEERRPVFGAFEAPDRHRDVVIRPDDDDFSDLEFTGYLDDACQQLRAVASGADADAETAADALALLVRLAGATT